MTDEFSQDMLLKVVAQICQMVGFHGITTSPLYTLVDILRMFICRLGQTAHHYAEHCGRSSPNVSDLSLAFFDFDIKLSELTEYLKYVDPLPPSLLVPKYPVTSNKASIPIHDSHRPEDFGSKYSIDQEQIKAVNISPAPGRDESEPTVVESVESNNNECKEPIKITICLNKIKTATRTKKIRNPSKKIKKKKKSKRSKAKK